jgi:gas vesicle protein
VEKGIAIGLIAGAAIGAGLGLLYAPQSGKKTRKEIIDRAGDLGETVKKRAEDFGSAVSENAEKYRRKMMETIK